MRSWGWSTSNTNHQTQWHIERETTPASSPPLLSPVSPLLLPSLNASSLESAAGLAASWSTPNLWPLTPSAPLEFITEPSAERAQRGRASCETLSCWQVNTGVTDVLLRRLHLRPFTLILAAHCAQKSLLGVCHDLNLWVCVSQPHLSRCSWVKERILLFLDGKLPATERSGYKSAALSSLLKKHVPVLSSYVSLLLLFFPLNGDRILHRYASCTPLEEITSAAYENWLRLIQFCYQWKWFIPMLWRIFIFEKWMVSLLHSHRMITDSLLVKNVLPSRSS